MGKQMPEERWGGGMEVHPTPDTELFSLALKAMQSRLLLPPLPLPSPSVSRESLETVSA